MTPIRIAIVDNEEVFREGTARLLQEQAKMEIVFQGNSSKEAIEKCQKTQPDLVLIDSHMMDCEALRTVQALKDSSPAVRVVMMSRTDSEKDPLDFIKAGARAFLAKNIAVTDLVKSLELVSSGRIIISPFFAEKFLESLSLKQIEENKTDPVLSKREIEIAKLIAQGATNKEIAEILIIAENTVKVHVKNILSKLELKNRQQLAVYAVMKEWIKHNSEAEMKDKVNPV